MLQEKYLLSHKESISTEIKFSDFQISQKFRPPQKNVDIFIKNFEILRFGSNTGPKDLSIFFSRDD